tara:strand:+ start:423 stop:917 length:495 start_codon:yes stop_codon:yes gene_type:complete
MASAKNKVTREFIPRGVPRDVKEKDPEKWADWIINPTPEQIADIDAETKEELIHRAKTKANDECYKEIIKGFDFPIDGKVYKFQCDRDDQSDYQVMAIMREDLVKGQNARTVEGESINIPYASIWAFCQSAYKHVGDLKTACRLQKDSFASMSETDLLKYLAGN